MENEAQVPFLQPRYNWSYGKWVANPFYTHELLQQFETGEWIKFHCDQFVPMNQDTIIDYRHTLNNEPVTGLKCSDINWYMVSEYRKAEVAGIQPAKPAEENAYYNLGAWIKFIPGDKPCWNPGDLVDVRYMNGDTSVNLRADTINWDTVAKYRKAKPTSEPESFHSLTTQQGTVVDPNSRYYDVGGIETIEVIKAKLTPEQLKGYLLGNIIKYSCRLNFKGSAERDAEKLKFYSNWLEQLK